MLPWLGIVCGLAATAEDRKTAWAAGISALVGIAVAVDFHFGPPTAFDTLPTPQTQGLEVPWRAGLSTSADRRGWARADDLPAHRSQVRVDLLAAVHRCGATSITGSDRVLGPSGDLNWWTFSLERSALSGAGEPAVFLPVGSPLGPLPTEPTLFVLPEPADRFGPAPRPPSDWMPLSQGPEHVQIWAPPGLCESFQ